MKYFALLLLSLFTSTSLQAEQVFDCAFVANLVGKNNKICLERGLSQPQRDYACAAMAVQTASGFAVYFQAYSFPIHGDLYAWSKDDVGMSPCKNEWVYDTSKPLSRANIAPDCSFDGR